MSMSEILKNYLSKNHIHYQMIPHKETDTSINSAYSAKVSAAHVAKSVILNDEKGLVMAVVPANHRIKINQLNKVLDRELGLAPEEDVKEIFSDCAPGAIPPIGQAYGIETIVDASLDNCQDIYLEAGDHTELIHMSGSSFRKLMQDVKHADIC